MSQQSNSCQLGFAEFVPKYWSSASTDATRNHFLRAVARIAPEVVNEAARLLLPPYKLLVEKLEELHLDSGRCIAPESVDPAGDNTTGKVSNDFRALFFPESCRPKIDDEEVFPPFARRIATDLIELHNYRFNLAQWMISNNLIYLWVIDGLQQPLEELRKCGWPNKQIDVQLVFKEHFGSSWTGWLFPVGSFRQDLKVEIEFAYDPLRETRRDARKGCEAIFAHELKAFLDKTDKAMVEQGFVRTSKKHSERHFDWTVKHYVLGQSWQVIAEKDDIDESVVRKSAQAIYRRMNPIWDRTGPGRPPRNH